MSLPLSGFTAVPNPQMLAFMGAQSFIMMYQAGEGWQYGKRKISAMSNEEFNKLTPQMVLEKQAVVLRDALGTIAKSMNDMTPLIGTIVEQYGDFLKEILEHIPKGIENAGTGSSLWIVDLIKWIMENQGKSSSSSFPPNLLPSAGASPVPVSPSSSSSGGGAAINEATVKFTNYMNALTSMTKVQLQYAGQKGILEQGFTPNRVVAAGKEVIRLLNILNASVDVGLQLPPSDVSKQIGSGGVSTQTLKIQRGLIIKKMNAQNVRVTNFTNHMNTLPSNMRYQYKQGTLDPAKRKLQVIKQELSDFLSKWAGRF